MDIDANHRREGGFPCGPSLQLNVVALVALLGSLVSCTPTPVPHVDYPPVPYRHDTEQLTGAGYYIYVPSTYNHNKPAPIVITCHGNPPSDTAEYHIREWQWLGENYSCIVVAPEMTSRCGIFGPGPLAAMLEDEKRILSIISQLGYRYNIDRANTMITGYYDGAFPAYWVGLRHPDVFSVVVGRSCDFAVSDLDGHYPPEAIHTPVMIYYASNDLADVQEQSDKGVDYLRQMGFKVEIAVIPGAAHERRPEVATGFFLRHRRPAEPSLPGSTTTTNPARH